MSDPYKWQTPGTRPTLPEKSDNSSTRLLTAEAAYQTQSKQTGTEQRHGHRLGNSNAKVSSAATKSGDVRLDRDVMQPSGKPHIPPTVSRNAIATHRVTWGSTAIAAGGHCRSRQDQANRVVNLE